VNYCTIYVHTCIVRTCIFRPDNLSYTLVTFFLDGEIIDPRNWVETKYGIYIKYLLALIGKLSNALAELGYKWHLEVTAGVILTFSMIQKEARGYKESVVWNQCLGSLKIKILASPLISRSCIGIVRPLTMNMSKNVLHLKKKLAPKRINIISVFSCAEGK